MDPDFEEYYMLVCYDLHKMDVDPELASINRIKKAFRDDLEANAAACIEFERIKFSENPPRDFD